MSEDFLKDTVVQMGWRSDVILRQVTYSKIVFPPSHIIIKPYFSPHFTLTTADIYIPAKLLLNEGRLPERYSCPNGVGLRIQLWLRGKTVNEALFPWNTCEAVAPSSSTTAPHLPRQPLSLLHPSTRQPLTLPLPYPLHLHFFSQISVSKASGSTI